MDQALGIRRHHAQDVPFILHIGRSHLARFLLQQQTNVGISRAKQYVLRDGCDIRVLYGDKTLSHRISCAGYAWEAREVPNTFFLDFGVWVSKKGLGPLNLQNKLVTNQTRSIEYSNFIALYSSFNQIWNIESSNSIQGLHWHAAF